MGATSPKKPLMWVGLSETDAILLRPSRLSFPAAYEPSLHAFRFPLARLPPAPLF
jgi:hypothetical protein